MEPCVQEQNISRIMEGQNTLVKELKDSFSRLENILLADVEHRKDIAQLKKESDILFNKQRLTDETVVASFGNVNGRISQIEHTRALYDGAEVLSRSKTMWDWRQQELGWRRFIPAAMAALAWLATMVDKFPIKG